MKKLFFPLVAVVGLTAMSFTDVKAETREVKEVSIQEFVQADEDGRSMATKHVCWDVFTEHIYKMDMYDVGISNKLDKIIEKY